MPFPLRDTLLKIFGYSTFWPLQEEIITSVMVKQDVLAVLPTGGGKSICYQIPAILSSGLTVVLSPLISLMKDQVDQLNKLGIHAVVLNSSLTPRDYQQNKADVVTGKAKLLYLAPESLVKPDIQAMLEHVNLTLFAVDEAHCVSVWGHDFRPEYRQLIRYRRLYPNATWIALTATATSRVRQDIQVNLGLHNPKVFVGSFNRKNLFLEVLPKKDSYGQIKKILEDHPDQSGIIYCFSRKQVDLLSERLSNDGYSVKPYHAGLADEERHANQRLFVNDNIQIIVATIAFGMGINKPNVRFVIHNDLPKNLESYYQEIGRAGRDGLPSDCVLLYNYGDMRKQMVFIEEMQNPELKASAIRHLNDMAAYAEHLDCRRKPLLKYFGEDIHDANCGGCDNCSGKKTDRTFTDQTKEARLFLSAMIEVNEFFGSEHIIDILRGSSNEKIQKFRHDELASYGVGKNQSKKDWQGIRDAMIQSRLIKKDLDHFGVLKILPDGKEVLAGRKIFEAPYAGKPIREAVKKSGPSYDHDLFEILRKKRKELADSENVPPYIIFPDTSLIEMAQQLPKDLTSFSRITGVGEIKLKKYSGEFLPLIAHHQKSSAPVPSFEKRETQANHIKTGKLFNEGRSIEEIAKELNLKSGTILEHLLRCLKEGYPVDSIQLKKLAPQNEKESLKILQEFHRQNDGYLKPVFEALFGAFSYDDLKFYQLIYWSEKK